MKFKNLLLCVLSLYLCSCAMVSLKPQDTREYIMSKRADVLTEKHLSASTMEIVGVVAKSRRECEKQIVDCIQTIEKVGLPQQSSTYLAAMSELWLYQAQRLQKEENQVEAYHDALMKSARYAYAYLFYGATPINQRVLDNRQMQVADYYNYAVQTFVNENFNRYTNAEIAASSQHGQVHIGEWKLHSDLSQMHLPQNRALPDHLIAATQLRFQGLRNVSQRDGFGAELVSVIDEDKQEQNQSNFSEMNASPATVLIHFKGKDLDEVLRSHDVVIQGMDPFSHETVTVNQQTVPLAANFTGAYGVWLANSGFARQSLKTLLGKDGGIEHPHVYLMQPYDPDRRIILMVHGLASSPEAWVNMANDLMGDYAIRQRYQIWQVYYPTNMPIALNHVAIRRVVDDTLRHFDPTGAHPASKDMVVVGHSMGGVISRMMIASDNGALDAWLKESLGTNQIPASIAELAHFQPMPQIGRVIFIAAPHNGTHVAGGKVGKLVSKAVRLPFRTLRTLDQALTDAFSNNKRELQRLQQRGVLVPNSIDNLDEKDPFIMASQNLKISSTIPYHSIIAQYNANKALEQSSDGVVPYSSAHLPHAQSEKIITSGHSVQENPQAILEIRRILHEDMRKK